MVMNENTKKLFETLFSALVMNRHNIHVLHWKCCGTDFEDVHTLMDSYLDKFNSLIDGIGEIMMELNINPLCLCSIIKNLEEDDEEYICISGDINYTSEKVFEHIATMFKRLIHLYEDIIEDEDIPSDIVSVLDEHKQWLRLERDYKNIQRVQ